jgi:hypothetical protein
MCRQADRCPSVSGCRREKLTTRLVIATIPLLLVACHSTGPGDGSMAMETALASTPSPVDSVAAAAQDTDAGPAKSADPPKETGPAPQTGGPDTPKAGADKWDFRGVLYLWAVGVSGVVTAGNTSNQINAKFGDILDNLDFAAMFNFQGRKGQWGFVGDFTYADLGGEAPGPQGVGDTDISLTMALVEADATFRPKDLRSLEFVGGVRVLDVHQTIDFPLLPSVRADAILIDPVVGAQGAWPLGKKWWFRLRGDIGGFGISSEFTYQVYGGFRWNFAGDFGLDLAYRILGYQIDQSDVEMDLTLQGLVLGLDYWF